MLTDIQIRNAQPREKRYRLSDGDKLYLEVAPGGQPRWLMRYSLDGKQRDLSLGAYPKVSLSAARKARDAAAALVAEGRDPSLEKKLKKRAVRIEQQNTFGKIIDEYVAEYDPRSPVRAGELAAMKRDGEQPHVIEAQRRKWQRTHQKRSGQVKHLDKLRYLPIREVTARELLDACLAVQAAGKAVTANELRTTIRGIFNYAVLAGVMKPEERPTDALGGRIRPAKVKGRAAIIDPAELAPLLKAIEGYEGSWATKGALRLGLLTFVRPGELRTMEWHEIDFETRRWTIPGFKMKREVEHWVPLSRQAIEELERLREVHRMERLQSAYVFPSRNDRSKCMSENTVNTALRAMGFAGDQVCGHGFRATASTCLAQVLKCDERWIERQLSHAEKNKVKAAYNRAEFWTERVKMMQDWADWLDHLRAGSPPVPIGTARAGQA